jgi:hypothetical protein
MAMTTCKECGKDISDTATSCPHCGYAKPKPRQVSGCMTTFIISGALLFAVSMCNTATAPKQQPKTPEQLTQEARKEEAFQKVVGAMAIIKKANRNPDSVVWENVLANDDASVICIEYRGQNGFGGMNKESIAFIKNKPTKDSKDWNKHCAGRPLNDMIHARHALK